MPQLQETLDLDLQLSPTSGGYLTRVLTSPAGQAIGSFVQPFTETEQTQFVEEIIPSGRPTSRLALQALMKEFGGQLFDALFHDDLLLCLERSLDEARRQNAILRIKLRLNEAPDLYALPWEYLYHRRRSLFLGHSTISSLTHYLELPEPALSLTIALPLRMLVIIAAPVDLPQLDAEREWTNLQTALHTLIQRGQLIVDRLPNATLAELQRTLRHYEYHAIHFVGHGDYDENAGQGRVVLTTDQGYAEPVAGEVLAQLLHNERTLRMVLLNACEGSRTSATNAFAGVAQQLVQQGIPAVIAMRHPISDEAAITFSTEFYAALADGYTVDAAVTEGRVAVATRLGNGEWGAPQLLMHAQDGVLWRLAAGQQDSLVNGDAIGEDLGVLTELMQRTNVRNLVAAYRADFDAASRQIDILSNYKFLHDLLHKLQFRCYNVIAQEARRFPDDELSLDNLLNYEVTLQDIVASLQAVIEEAEFSANETVWINDLLDAQQQFRLALDRLESDQLRRVIWLMRRVLALQPSNVNHRLNAAARALHLDTIVHSLNAIHDTLREFNIEADRIKQLESGVAELQRLDLQLAALVEEHDQWQEVQRMLGRIDDMMVYDLSELEFSWPDLNSRVTVLCAVHKGEWVDRFFLDGEQLQTALTEQNPVRVRSYFQRYRQRAGNRFFQVDTQLKDLCTELRKVGESLSAILRMLE
ncbi:MAG: CHAT domain-containing protein [Caldilineaceae bacterium]